MCNENQRFAKLAGFCWHEEVDNWTIRCKYCGAGMIFPWQGNPDLTDAREVLKVMRAKRNWWQFVEVVGCRYHVDISGDQWKEDMLPVDLFLDTTGKLRDLAIEWMEKEAE